MADTLTPAMGVRPVARDAPRTSALYVALNCERPAAPTSRHLLVEVEKASIGRGETAAYTRRQKELVLTLPDAWMSQRHAILRLSGARWIVEDAGSRNGTLVNGAPCTRAVLKDGDVLELGHTFLLFKENVSGRPPLDLDAKQLEVPAAGLATFSPALTTETGRLRTIARSTVSVVIHGESGSGKEFAARALHQLSGRPGPFVAVNCGGIAKNLVESEMFGYRKGAFSGADEDRPGLMRSADKGTLFLDEVADLPQAAQAVLLRALQESEVVPVGATRPVKIDVRVLAATHHDLQKQIAEGAFRADLFARISGFTVRLPALRERREDLGLLIGEILKRLTPDPVELTPAAARALFAYPWPLNVRELDKCLSTAMILAAGEAIDVQHLPDWAHPAQQQAADKPRPPPTEDDLRQRDELLALLKEHKGNVSSIARAMGKARMQVQRWLKRFQLDPEEFR
jgi:DNA-binding NtrC family response regulator